MVARPPFGFLFFVFLILSFHISSCSQSRAHSATFLCLLPHSPLILSPTFRAAHSSSSRLSYLIFRYMGRLMTSFVPDLVWLSLSSAGCPLLTELS